jgi:hypothetical protein
MDLSVIGWVWLQWIHLARGINQWLAFVKAVRSLMKQTNRQTNIRFDNYRTVKCRTTRRQRTSDFHKLRGIYWLAEQLLASQDGLSSMTIFIHSFFEFLQGIWTFLYVT